MTLPPRARLGAYEIVALAGAGGMGEVYRARDTRLNRDVALKVLPPDVAADAERLARFRREAQVLASLNHPHIAQVHGLEEGSSSPALVMEFVEGEDLAARLARGRIPFDEALPIARQIAEALEAAHEAGIVHRDLKPANIKIKDDGTVKVLDFGLAKAIDPGAGSRESGAASDNSPTITTPAMTRAGIILGTAAYMSPEQARGRPVDKRTDVWAFGCVLFEMLTGTRAFAGDDVSDTLAAILRADPDWRRWPAGVPEPVRRLVAGCLERDRRARVPDIGVARYVLAQPSAASLPASPAPAMEAPRRGRAAGVGVAAFIAGAAIAAAAAWLLAPRAAPPLPTARVRIAVDPPPLIGGSVSDLAIAADGSYIVYSTRDRLALRRLDQLESRVVDGTGGARLPFVSPDGRWIGYFLGAELKRVPASGGTPQTICSFAGTPRGAAWGEDGTIVFGSSLSNGLMRVTATGGTPTQLTRVDAATNPIHGFPSWLPDGRSLLFNILPPSGGAAVAVADAETGSVSVLSDPSGIAPSYLASGHLLTASPGELRITPFDRRRRLLTGEPIVVAEALTQSFVSFNFAVSSNGVLVYFPSDATAASAGSRTMVWVDRQGNETPIEAPARAYEVARVSPDGSRIALDIRDAESDIWIWDVARRTLARLTTDRSADMGPVWAADGQHLFYSSNAGGIPNLYRRRADGAGAVDRLTTTNAPSFVTSVSPDGGVLALFRAPSTIGGEIATLALGAKGVSAGETRSILSGSGMRFGGEISPDGRWIAYHSTESGQNEVYVRPFPNADVGRWQISTGGGSRPAWSRDGRELFYLNAANLLVSVPVSSRGDTFTAGTVTPLLKNAYVPGSTARGLDLRSYDVAPDGKRFLMIKDAAGAASVNAAPVIVVTNWLEELKRRAPARD